MRVSCSVLCMDKLSSSMEQIPTSDSRTANQEVVFFFFWNLWIPCPVYKNLSLDCISSHMKRAHDSGSKAETFKTEVLMIIFV
jgi:hypothetical protein